MLLFYVFSAHKGWKKLALLWAMMVELFRAALKLNLYHFGVGRRYIKSVTVRIDYQNGNNQQFVFDKRKP